MEGVEEDSEGDWMDIGRGKKVNERGKIRSY